MPDIEFEWVPLYEAIADAVAGYRNKQPELVKILQIAGIDNGLTDQDPEGNNVELTEIDPFTFFALINKYEGAQRAARLESIEQQFGLGLLVPKKFQGVPSAQAVKSWLFPYKFERNADDIPALWRLFDECRSDKLTDAALKRALDVRWVAKAKLTQALFWVAPRKYLPIDRQTKPYLQTQGITPDFNSVDEYLAICSAAGQKFGKPLYVISYDAWKAGQVAAAANVGGNNVQQPTAPYSVSSPVMPNPLNQILYGPPGTGKTYTTKRKAVEICLGSAPVDRQALSAEYERLRQQNRIEFVTFHQSFSYEDFVEGLRPVIDETAEKSDAEYECRPGVFKRICTAAEAALTNKTTVKDGVQLGNKRLFKMSLGDTKRPDEAYLYQECIEQGHILLGYGEGIDFTGCKTAAEISEKLKPSIPDIKSNDYNITSVYYLISEIKVGDLVLISDGNLKYRAIGEVTGEYEFLDRGGKDSYCQKRAVKWLRVYEESQPIDLIFSKRLSQMTVYLMDQSSIKHPALEAILAPQDEKAEPDNYVLIVDEINRANISKVLGELISLLEPDKRLGKNEQLRVKLPYSQKEFGVPKNLYVIGTMNTADRSIALLDTALRRRFDFVEMEPDYSVLDETGAATVTDEAGKPIDLRYVLMAINDRLEFLLGRDQRIGHAYLTGVKSFSSLVHCFTQQVIPLLKEYFYEDWNSVTKVLSVPKGVTAFVSKASTEASSLFGTGLDGDGYADAQDRYSLATELTGDMFRGLYAGRERELAKRLSTN